MIATALSIAGSDPSGGAGIQADLKTFGALGVFGLTAITALTAQNTRGVSGVHLVPAGFVQDQLASIFADVRVDAIKIGMIATSTIAEAVANALSEYAQDIPIILDPVMIAKGGASLLDPQAINILQTRLMPLATLMTPNLAEAAALLGEPMATTREQMLAQGRALIAQGVSAVLMKGGHAPMEECCDLLLFQGREEWFWGERIHTKNTHGTGCTLSSAIAAHMARGDNIRDAVFASKQYIQGAIEEADTLHVGTGHGPVHHFHALWT